MSLKVPADLLEQARQGTVSDADFIACIAESLPYAWAMITRLMGEVLQGAVSAVNREDPPDEEKRGQVLRLLASDAMRAAIERHFGVKLAFQNCCGVAVFTEQAQALHAKYVTTEAQLLNQRPELVNC